jgi:stringent starvation protein B
MATTPDKPNSTKPYLMRAIYEWCTDNGYTPYIAVAVDSRTVVPKQHVKNGEIVLNISFVATQGLKMENEYIFFTARFGGVARDLIIPVENVLAIYARENGQGMAFEPTAPVVADAEATDAPESASKMETPAEPGLSAVPTGDAPVKGDHDPEPPKKGGGGRPTLTRVK